MAAPSTTRRDSGQSNRQTNDRDALCVGIWPRPQGRGLLLSASRERYRRTGASALVAGLLGNFGSVHRGFRRWIRLAVETKAGQRFTSRCPQFFLGTDRLCQDADTNQEVL